ncbi:HAD-IIIC family phosphatase [Streptomyces solisilvae]|uniref:HAD-IIIC family phosphatase n=1 Tax=Streptomyces malaysiensis TaxID=92644 RepID=UPI0036C7072B
MTTSPAPSRPNVKCVVWDLDNTLWDGVLLEDPAVRLREDLVREIRRLDSAGILHSIASKNDPETALRKLHALGVAEYFLYPQISWNPKSSALRAISAALNIGLDTFAFVDDQPFELAEVAHALPQVRCVDVAEIHDALKSPEFQPRFVTEDARIRRQMYLSSARRDAEEQAFEGTSEEFLSTLGMEFTIAPARHEDLQRAEELTVRTHQLNSTGRTYSYDDLEFLRTSPDHLLLVATLRDKFGSYGTVGLCLLEKQADQWCLLLLLMSCRVMSRGVGTVMLNHVMALARARGVWLRADFVETDRNRQMYITYMFAGFREIEREGQRVLLESDLSEVQPPPPYLRLRLGGAAGEAEEPGARREEDA